VVVRCERCETRFKLDESRIPARGARVRCSRCKHAFFVTPPGAAKDALVHEVAAEAARAPAENRAPEPSWDLEEGPDATIARRRSAAAAPGAPGQEADDDNDWRFEDDVPGLDPGATRSGLDLTGARTAPSLAAVPDANESSFAELGDPETWDLLAGDAPSDGLAPQPIAEPDPERLAPSPPPAPAAADPPLARTAAAPAVDGEVAAADAPQPRERVAPAARRTAFAPPAVVVPRTLPPAPRHPSAMTWAGWAGVALLVAATAWGALRPASSGAGAVRMAPVAGFEVSEARARIVENAAAGPILVVSGRLRNPGPASRALGAPLAVQLLDDDGAPIAGASVEAGAALSEASLREDAPETLLAAQQAAAGGFAAAPVAAGAELGFAAVFAPAPHGAHGIALAQQASARR
jgi:predicted Zn finger-like uncharacterized protein